MIESIPLVEIQPPVRDLTIVKAAVKLGDRVFTGWRHADILHHLIAAGTPQRDQEAQGFVADNGSFYNRYQSARIALRARQIGRLPHVLTSEDLWENDGTPRDGLPYNPGGDFDRPKAVDTKQDAINKAAELRHRTRGRR